MKYQLASPEGYILYDDSTSPPTTLTDLTLTKGEYAVGPFTSVLDPSDPTELFVIGLATLGNDLDISGDIPVDMASYSQGCVSGVGDETREAITDLTKGFLNRNRQSRNAQLVARIKRRRGKHYDTPRPGGQGKQMRTRLPRFGKHYPGGKDHDQKTHGNRGTGTQGRLFDVPKTFLERAGDRQANLKAGKGKAHFEYGGDYTSPRYGPMYLSDPRLSPTDKAMFEESATAALGRFHRLYPNSGLGNVTFQVVTPDTMLSLEGDDGIGAFVINKDPNRVVVNSDLITGNNYDKAMKANMAMTRSMLSIEYYKSLGADPEDWPDMVESTLFHEVVHSASLMTDPINNIALPRFSPVWYPEIEIDFTTDTRIPSRYASAHPMEFFAEALADVAYFGPEAREHSQLSHVLYTDYLDDLSPSNPVPEWSANLSSNIRITEIGKSPTITVGDLPDDLKWPDKHWKREEKREKAKNAIKDRIKKHADHDQSTHGNWSRGTSARQTHDITTEREGRTVNVTTGSEPTTGYAVADSRYTHTIPPGELDPGDIRRYIQRNREALTSPNAHLGTWLDPTTGTTWLDVSYVYENEDQATQRAQSQGELALYHLDTGTTIRLDQ